MRSLVYLTIGLLLLLSLSVSATESGNAVHKSVATLAAEIAEFHGLDTEIPEWYRAPRPDMPFKVITYAGAECILRFQVIEGTSPVARFAWDFDSDGILDWESKYYQAVKHVFDATGKQHATFYVFDVHGQYGSVEMPVEVMSGSGEPRLEPYTLKLSLTGVQERRDKALVSVAPDPEKAYFILFSDEDGHWKSLVDLYHRLVDSLGCTDEEIVCVVGTHLSCPDDQHIIDYGYRPEGVDSAFNFLLANMTINDDLHIVSICHGGGMTDSSYYYYDENAPGYRVHQLVGGRLFAGGDDPDLFVTEDEFMLAMSGWNHTGHINTGVGLDEWAGKWSIYENPDIVYRRKYVETFNGMKFTNTRKKNDNDIYIETIRQYLRGDKNRDGIIDPNKKEVWDWDEDGNPPIELVGDIYVFDEDDWGMYELILDNEDTLWNSYSVYFDEGSDGTVDVCQDCLQYFPNPVAHGTDLDGDGVLDKLDVNHDGDWLDSVGVDETGFRGYDNDVAEFLDNLEYRYVTMIMYNCFSGGFINDVSRPDVAIATGSPEGTLSYGAVYPMWKALTGGVRGDEEFEPAEDRIVTFMEAYNCIETYANDDGRARLDDNGDRIGHVYPLPADGDGIFANELTWGTLPPVAPPVGKPVMMWPLQHDWTYDIMPTLIWSDTADADSFKVQWGNEDFSVGGYAITADTTFTLTSHVNPLPYSDLYWHVRAYKSGFTTSQYTDSVSFDILIDYDCCIGMRGNVDGDPEDDVNQDDLDYLVAYLWQGGPPPPCFPEANVDGSEGNEIPGLSDMMYLQAYIMGTGPEPVSCLGYICGDADGSGEVNAMDATFLSDYFYHGGPPPEPAEAADMDCVPGLTEADLDYLIAYLWQGGPAPCDCE